MIEVKAFKAEDFGLIYDDAIDDQMRTYTPEQIGVMGVKYENSGCAFTGWYGDIPMGCLGILEVRPGIGNMWSALNREVQNHIVISMRAVKRMLQIVDQTHDFKVLRSDSRIGFPESQRFLEFLGFTKGRRNLLNGTHYFYRRT